MMKKEKIDLIFHFAGIRIKRFWHRNLKRMIENLISLFIVAFGYFVLLLIIGLMEVLASGL